MLMPCYCYQLSLARLYADNAASCLRFPKVSKWQRFKWDYIIWHTCSTHTHALTQFSFSRAKLTHFPELLRIRPFYRSELWELELVLCRLGVIRFYHRFTHKFQKFCEDLCPLCGRRYPILHPVLSFLTFMGFGIWHVPIEKLPRMRVSYQSVHEVFAGQTQCVVDLCCCRMLWLMCGFTVVRSVVYEYADFCWWICRFHWPVWAHNAVVGWDGARGAWNAEN